MVKRTSLVGVGETHGLKKGDQQLVDPLFSLSETNSDTFFKHKNRPILEWCVSALVRIFHDKRFEKFTKFRPAPLTAGDLFEKSTFLINSL